MKYLRISSRPDPDVAPAAFRLIADSPHVEETRMIGWNAVDSRGLTALFVVDGDLEAVGDALVAESPLAAADVAPADGESFYLLATIDTEETPLAGPVFETLTRDGLVVVKPTVYRDGAVHARMVGETAAVQAAVEHLPPAVEVTVHEVGRGGLDPGSAVASLPDRQRETLRVAVEMGYYDTPRAVTHEDIAARLECSPSTVSEHLQKAEGRLVTGAMAASAPGAVFEG